MSVKPIPEGFHTITPYLVLKDVAGCIEFMEKAFGGTVIERIAGPEGRVAHAEVKIGDSIIMMGGATDDHPPVPAMLYLYVDEVDEVDAVYKQAVAAGATSIMEPADQFYGDRNGGVKDNFGNTWWIATHIEDLTPEEISKRAAKAMADGQHS